jgi:hypothetical protein
MLTAPHESFAWAQVASVAYDFPEVMFGDRIVALPE